MENTVKVDLEVNAEKVRGQLEGLNKYLVELNKKKENLIKDEKWGSLSKINREITKTEREISRVQTTAANVKNVLDKMDKASPRELQRSLKVLNRQLEMTERGTSEWIETSRKIKDVKSEIHKVNSELERSSTLGERVKGVISSFSQSLIVGVAGTVATGRLITESIENYASTEQEMANVRKFTGLTTKEIELLNEEFKKIDTRTSRIELNKLAEEAGKLGKSSSEDVLGFVKAADQINVALDELGEGATLTISKLTNIFGDEERLGTEKAMLSVGSVINELSQNSTASASYLAEFAQRMAGIGAQAKMTIPQIMAFAAVLDSNGQQIEMSSSALSKVMTDMFKNPAKIAQAAGLEVSKFTNLVKNDTNQALIVLLQRLNEMGGVQSMAPVFADMGENGIRVMQVLASLAGNIDDVVAQQEVANRAFGEAVSVTKEFDVQNNTVQASLEKSKNRFRELSVQLGEKMMPAVDKVIKAGSGIVRVMTEIISFISENRKVIISLVTAIVAYQAAVKAAALATKVKTVAIDLYQRSVLRAVAAQEELNAAQRKNLFLLVASAIVAVITYLAEYISETKKAAAASDYLGQLNKEVSTQMADQQTKINLLTKTLNDNNSSLDARREALNKLKELVPEYHAELTNEGKLINNNTDAIDKYLERMRLKIQYDAAQAKLTEIAQKQIEQEDSIESAKERYEEKKTKFERYKGSPLQLIYEPAKQSALFDIEEETDKMTELEKAYAKIEKKALEAQEKIFAIEQKTKKKSQNNPGSDTAVVPGTEEKTEKAEREVLKGLKEWKEKEEALNRIAYATGEENHRDFEQRKIDIQREYYQKALADSKLNNEERLKIQAEAAELEAKVSHERSEKNLQNEERGYQLASAAIKQRYADGELTTRQYNQALEMLELSHMNEVVQIYKEGTEERLKAERAYEDKQRECQIKHAEENKSIQEKIRKEFFNNAPTAEDRSQYDYQIEMLQAVKEKQMELASESATERYEIEEAYEKAVLALKKRYNIDGINDAKNSLEDFSRRAVEWMESDGGKAFTGTLEQVTSIMGSIFTQLQDLIQAEIELETSAIEAEYDTRVRKAEGNKAVELQLEEEKNAKIANIKTGANRRMFAMQVMQAIAQTAQAAISAYSSAAAIPMVGWVLAPIAAGAAAAAGALQIAAIKQQQSASESQGYAEGGFTRPGKKKEVAGIVHAGEWVASQELVNSPTARPLINALEYAQRTNSIASLKADNISDRIMAPTRISKFLSSRDSNGDGGLAVTIERLNERLNEPFVTINTVTGDAGIKKAQDRYLRLQNNKGPKYRKA